MKQTIKHLKLDEKYYQDPSITFFALPEEVRGFFVLLNNGKTLDELQDLINDDRIEEAVDMSTLVKQQRRHMCDAEINIEKEKFFKKCEEIFNSIYLRKEKVEA